MSESMAKKSPGIVRDAIIESLRTADSALTAKEIHAKVEARIGETPKSSIRSYLSLNKDSVFQKVDRGEYVLNEPVAEYQVRDLFQTEEVEKFKSGRCSLFNQDCFDFLDQRDACSIHAIVTDPPYGLVEYTDKEKNKLRAGKGGNWRIPPSFDGNRRSPLPRFTTLTQGDLNRLQDFFFKWGVLAGKTLVPGGNLMIASNPLVSHLVSSSLAKSGLERRGEVIRLVMTMRGGDRPKHAHEEFSEVSVMPRSMWEPWLIFRKPLEGRVQDNLRRWKTGGFRRISDSRPFGDVIKSAPTRAAERNLAPHPSLKPQAFMRQIVRGSLPLGEGIVLDPFAGAGSTLAAANAVGYESIGVESDKEFFEAAKSGIPLLTELKVEN